MEETADVDCVFARARLSTAKKKKLGASVHYRTFFQVIIVHYIYIYIIPDSANLSISFQTARVSPQRKSGN